MSSSLLMLREAALSADGAGACLLVVDMQRFCADACAGSEYFQTALPQVTSNISLLQRAFRSSCGTVLFTVIENLTQDGRDRGLDYKISGFNVPKGSSGAEMLPALAPAEDEIVLPKTSSSPFNSTQIDFVLRSLGVKQLVVCGGLTEQCISSTVRDAADLGYLVTVATDACIAKATDLHTQGLRHISGYGRQRRSSDIIAELTRATHLPVVTNRFVRLLWCDAAGRRRARMVVSSKLSSTAATGLGLTEACMALPAMADVPATGSGLSAVGEVRLVPDLDSCRPVPWHKSHSFAMCHMEQPLGVPWECCPRNALKRALVQASDTCDKLEIFAGFELEFSLLRMSDLEPFDNSLYCSSRSLDAASEVLDDILGALADLRIGVDQIHAESASGQYEIVLTHGPALKAVDELVLAREAITGVAAKHDLIASFLPKRSASEAGNGSHAHFSIARGGLSAFCDAGSPPYKISAEGVAFMAGVLDRLPALLALTAPSPNSFRRIVPSCWSGAFKCWGIDNREAPIRLATPPAGLASAPPTNFEVKSFDATSNPYIGVAGIVVAGIHGIKNRATLPPPMQVDPATLHPGSVEPLPTTVSAAVEALESDAVLGSFLGAKLMKALVAVRRSEEKHFGGMDLAEEAASLLLRY